MCFIFQNLFYFSNQIFDEITIIILFYSIFICVIPHEITFRMKINRKKFLIASKIFFFLFYI